MVPTSCLPPAHVAAVLHAPKVGSVTCKVDRTGPRSGCVVGVRPRVHAGGSTCWPAKTRVGVVLRSYGRRGHNRGVGRRARDLDLMVFVWEVCAWGLRHGRALGTRVQLHAIRLQQHILIVVHKVVLDDGVLQPAHHLFEVEIFALFAAGWLPVRPIPAFDDVGNRLESSGAHTTGDGRQYATSPQVRCTKNSKKIIVRKYFVKFKLKSYFRTSIMTMENKDLA